MRPQSEILAQTLHRQPQYANTDLFLLSAVVTGCFQPSQGNLPGYVVDLLTVKMVSYFGLSSFSVYIRFQGLLKQHATIWMV